MNTEQQIQQPFRGQSLSMRNGEQGGKNVQLWKKKFSDPNNSFDAQIVILKKLNIKKKLYLLKFCLNTDSFLAFDEKGGGHFGTAILGCFLLGESIRKNSNKHHSYYLLR